MDPVLRLNQSLTATINPSSICSYIFSQIFFDSYLNGTSTHIPIESNADVGGVGVSFTSPLSEVVARLLTAKRVIISFATTAFVTLLLVSIYYMSACLSRVDPASCDRIDSAIIRRTQQLPLLCLINKRMPYWEPRLRTAILMYSDQQLIAGIALLNSAYTQLGKSMTSYHWQLAIYLAWYSSFAHLCTLTVLRQSFWENKRIRRLRLPLMFVNVILLICALIPTGHSLWLSEEAFGAINVRCFFKSYDNIPFDVSGRGLNFLISVIILVFGSVSRAVRLSPGASQMARGLLIEWPSHLLGGGLRKMFCQDTVEKGKKLGSKDNLLSPRHSRPVLKMPS